MKKDDTLFARLLMQYEAFNRAEGKSPKTVTWYNTALYALLDYLKKEPRQPRLGDVDLRTIREYILTLQQRSPFINHPFAPPRERPLSATNIQCYVRAIRAFFNWLYRE